MYRAIILTVSALCIALSGQAVQQNASHVTATVVGQTEFKTGDTVRLIVRLTPAPSGYGGGQVVARISRTPSQPSSVHSTDEELREKTSAVPLLDGVSEYEFRFKVTALFESGDWRVESVRYGRATSQVFPSPEGAATFKINTEEPPIKISSFSGPTAVANGTKAIFRIVIDKDFAPISVPDDLLNTPLPNDQCPDNLSIRFSAEKPSPGSELNFGIKLEPGKLLYEVPFERLPDAQPTGKWHGKIVSTKFYNRTFDGCRRPKTLLGETEVSFEVTPSKTLVVPTDVQVILSPSDVQLLRVQASALRHQVEALQRTLAEEGTVNERTLRDAVAAALNNLSETEQAYNKQAHQRDVASPIFFDDLRGIYHDLLLTLSASTNQNTRLRYVSTHTVDTAKTVIESIWHNEKAYNTVAVTQRWTFTLKLRTEPQGANILYRRKPDPFKSFHDPTNSEIENLPIAIWFVRFEKDGYEPKEVSYDAATETDAIHSTLEKLPKRKVSR